MLQKVRFSAANLVLTFGCAETGVQHYVGLLNRKALEKKGQRLLTPPGGAIELTEKGASALLSLGAEFEEEPGTSGIDARFTIPADRLEEVFRFFETRDEQLFEISAERELMEELGQKELALQDGPLLTAAELTQIELQFTRSIRQPLPLSGSGTSAREGSIPTRRLFNVFHANTTQAVLKKLQESEAVEFLTQDEVATTQGGRCKGLSHRGSTIGDNVFLLP